MGQIDCPHIIGAAVPGVEPLDDAIVKSTDKDWGDRAGGMTFPDAVANTLKRVVIIAYSCVIFNTPMTTLGAIGSGIAVTGTLLYSLAKKKYSK